jgi:hypothetical protein
MMIITPDTLSNLHTKAEKNIFCPETQDSLSETKSSAAFSWRCCILARVPFPRGLDLCSGGMKRDAIMVQKQVSPTTTEHFYYPRFIAGTPIGILK